MLVLALTACSLQSRSSGGADGLHSVVPDVVGLAEADARATIADAGYAVGEVIAETSEALPAGTIVSQDPIANVSAPRGSEVDLVVAAQ
jgi:beta-lactam-binding protein with PASTA domain